MKSVHGICSIRCIVLFLAVLIFLATGCASTEYPAVELVDQTPSISEMALSREKGRLEFIERENAPAIPVRIFGEAGSGIPVIMTHGLQSHSGWFTQSAQFIADLGMPAYAFDRSGSGLSTAKRGHCKSFRDWIEELRVVVNTVLRKHGVTRVHLMGHCFGAIPAAAYACDHPETVASLVLCTPAIYTRKGVYFRDMIIIGATRITGQERYIPVRLTPDMFTDLPEYEKFISEDNLSLSFVTAQFYYEVPRARRYIAKHAANLTMPVFMAIAEKDVICDNTLNRQFFDELRSKNKIIKSYTDAEHVLEFSREKEVFLTDLANWFAKFR